MPTSSQSEISIDFPPPPPLIAGRRLGIIGAGRFGSFWATCLSNYAHRLPKKHQFTVELFGRSSHRPLLEIGSADIVIPCVPISSFAAVMQQIAPLLHPSTVVMDVCSVKMFPVQVMLRTLPETIEILGSHPVFGPDSFAKNDGLRDLPMVLTQVRCQEKTYQQMKTFLQHLQLNILEMSAEEHDRAAAFSQAYAFLIGKIGQRMDIQPTPIDTMWYKLLLEERHAIEHDSEQLFADIQLKNPHAQRMRVKFRATLQNIFNELGDNTKQ